MTKEYTKAGIAVISDFDGTLTSTDSLEILLDEFVDEDWLIYEKKYEEGEITGSEALESEIALLDISLNDAIEFLKGRVKLTDRFLLLYNLCRDAGIPFEIVSCNFEQIIKPILIANNLNVPLLKSNRLIEKNGKLVIKPGQPAHPDCDDCHHCKMITVRKYREKGFFTIYLGDGHTDRCGAWEADKVFAKARLKKAFLASNLKFEELESLDDVISYIKKIKNDPPVSEYEADKRDLKENPFIKLKRRI